MILLGKPFSASEAKDAGLVNDLVAPEALAQAADALAAELAALPRDAVRLSKRLLGHAAREAVNDALSREGELFIERLRLPEAMEAIMAFIDRRGSAARHSS